MRAFILMLPVITACSLYFPSSGDDGGNGGLPDAGVAPFDGTPRRVFVTSTRYQGGALGGLAGADRICNAHAAQAQLSGTYRAWLSTQGSSAGKRMTHRAVPYVTVTGQTIASSWSDLVSGQLATAPNIDELGRVIVAADACMLEWSVWTATDYAGRLVIDSGDVTCGGWTDRDGYGDIGDASQVDPSWSDWDCNVPCTELAPLYCVEQ